MQHLISPCWNLLYKKGIDLTPTHVTRLMNDKLQLVSRKDHTLHVSKCVALSWMNYPRPNIFSKNIYSITINNIGFTMNLFRRSKLKLRFKWTLLRYTNQRYYHRVKLYITLYKFISCCQNVTYGKIYMGIFLF